MWRPGFEYEAAIPARLNGAHRAMCMYSYIYRGTPAVPGLVLGLDLGGWCQGIAFRVAPALWQPTARYLYRREMVTNIYCPAMRPVTLLDGSRRTVRALAFLVNRRHVQYAGDLPPPVQAAIVRRARGIYGANADYVAQTAAHLRALGICDPRMEGLMRLIGRRVAR
jgi:glutathione-specific gamma-glutamylcyclotransferase